MSDAPSLEMLKTIPGGGKIERSYGGLLYIVTTGEQTPDHIAAWHEAVSEIYRTIPNDQTVYVLFDASSYPISPSVRQNLMGMQAVAQARSLVTRVAFVVREDNKKELQVFANLTSSGKSRIKVTSNLEEGYRWLEDNMNLQ